MTTRIEDLRKNPFLNPQEVHRFAAWSGAVEGAYQDGGQLEGSIAATRIIDAAMAGHWEYPVPVKDMLRGVANMASKRLARTIKNQE